MNFDTARVIWSEGMFLRPHHFQQQERFFEWLLQARFQQLQAFGWGFSELVIDAKLNRKGKFAIESASGLLQDGSPFDVPLGMFPVRPLDVPVGTRDAVVHLHAVMRRPEVKAFSTQQPDRAQTRFQSTVATLYDDVTGSNATADVQVGVLNLTLDLDRSLHGGLTSLPVARIIERRGDEVVLDPDFIPPMLDSMANRWLVQWIHEIEGLVRQRAQMIQGRMDQAGGRHVTDLLLLQLCNRYQPLLAQWCTGSPIHPYALHQELLKLAGESRTFDPKPKDGKPRPPLREFPPYAHAGIAECLKPVVDEIRRAMLQMTEQSAIQIPVIHRGRGLYSAVIPDASMIDSGRFVLGVTANLPEVQIRHEFPPQTRICSPEQMAALSMAVHRGIGLEALSGVPAEIRYHADFIYFVLDDQSDKWTEVRLGLEIAILVAGTLPGVSLELWFIRSA